jgi:hypothetical protein
MLQLLLQSGENDIWITDLIWFKILNRIISQINVFYSFKDIRDAIDVDKSFAFLKSLETEMFDNMIHFCFHCTEIKTSDLVNLILLYSYLQELNPHYIFLNNVFIINEIMENNKICDLVNFFHTWRFFYKWKQWKLLFESFSSTKKEKNVSPLYDLFTKANQYNNGNNNNENNNIMSPRKRSNSLTVSNSNSFSSLSTPSSPARIQKRIYKKRRKTISNETS